MCNRFIGFVLFFTAIVACAGNNTHVVFIDPGHGGEDSGYISSGGMVEKDITLSVARKIKEKLSSGDKLKVFLTRENNGYVGLRSRVKTVDDYKASLMISVHTSEKACKGNKPFCINIYCSTKRNKKSCELESSIFDSLVFDGNIDSEKMMNENFIILKSMDVPSVIIEFGEIDTLKKYNLFKDNYLRKAIDSIGNGVVKFLEVKT
ncbi:N-acetylmuramoyl-L-alanine amidase family protein [Spartinivicinus ruber]|uniref:N-acetylmuramoyl-L-alanine amidase family protein n=1 Tax=Spartinivicinus ruber TaxID=2683272 RepID=UPI0013D7ED18|nr:N-acetylmuramoyl-L-alanine amidase [Spartinivicinus ruber]